MPKLKPCPFCGGEAVFEETRGTSRGYALCTGDECGVEGRVDSTAAAIAAWNRRASDWISVSERLPDNGGDMVFVWHAAEELIGIATYSKHDGWRGIAGEGAPTHWMEVPESPEVDGD